MHDVHGKPLKLFDRVRAATEEELKENGVTFTRETFDGERVVAALLPQCETCGVQLVGQVGSDEPIMLTSTTGKYGTITYPFTGGAWWATARTLAKLEG